MLHTTFKLAKQAGACEGSYRKFARYVGGIKVYGIDTPIPLTEILDVLGVDDALWCLRCTVEDDEKFSRLLACDYVEHVLDIFENQYPNDDRPRKVIEIARRFADGKATQENLMAAWDTAWAAAWDVDRDVHMSVDRDATWDAWVVTRAAVWAATWNTAWKARAAAWAAACTAKATAWAAARIDTGDATWADALVAIGDAACGAVEDAERKWQENRLRELLSQ